jgi:2-iminoacetate synthase
LDRAMEAGLDDVGIGALLGLHDYRFEVLAMMFHARHLERRFGAGPHTMSVPRIEPAECAPAAARPPAPLSDVEFKKVVAVLRMAVPYTGIILSTRERASLRTELMDLGVSQMSAGSQTSPGGYSATDAVAQFSVGDQRSLDEVIADIARHGYIPSFCTGCYRKGRTGQDFMDLAKPGLIRAHCLPNALFTFQEYIQDYASSGTREAGERAIGDQVAREVPDGRRADVGRVLARIRNGERDVYF